MNTPATPTAADMLNARIAFKHPAFETRMTGQIIDQREYNGGNAPKGTYLLVRYTFEATGATRSRWMHEDCLVSYVRPAIENAIAA